MSHLDKWGLHHWSYYINERDTLNEDERDQAAIFFRALKTLSPDDVAFLARKYKTGTRAYPNTRGTTDRPISDQALADQLGMDVGALGYRRRKLEHKLALQMIQERVDLPSRKAARMGRYKLKLDWEYLVSIEMKSLGYINLLLTDDPKKATIFTSDDGEMHWGILFKKVPVEEEKRKR